MALRLEWGVLVHEVIGLIPTVNSNENILDINIQVHVLFGSHMSEQKSQTVPQYIWGSFRNNNTIQNISREKSPSSSDPCHFVASTLCSISRESLRNLGQCMTTFHDDLSVRHGHIYNILTLWLKYTQPDPDSE